MKKVMIIEAQNQHLEVLYPQVISLLNEGFQVFVAVNEYSYEVDLINSLKNDNNVNFVVRQKKQPLFSHFYNLRKFIIKKKINTVIINTLESSEIAFLYNIFLRKFNTIRIIHNLDYVYQENRYDNKFKDYMYRRTIKKINRSIKYNFVLNEDVYKTAVGLGYKNMGFFYPIFFDRFYSSQINNKDFNNNNIIKIGVQGKVHFSRRNYLSLIDSLKKMPASYSHRIKIYIIGNINTEDGRIFLKEIKNYGLHKNFVVFNEFINYKKFFELINEMHFLLPLIDSSIDNYDKYNKHKITSTESMALVFKKPMISSKEFKHCCEFKDVSLRYEGENITNAFIEILKMTKEDYQYLINNYSSREKYVVQQKKYISIINKFYCKERSNPK